MVYSISSDLEQNPESIALAGKLDRNPVYGIRVKTVILVNLR